MDNDEKIAYLRSLPRTDQCQLSFQFIYRQIQQEINAVRKVRDSIQSLIEHTRNKIQKILSKDGKENIHINDIQVLITANGSEMNNFACWDFINVAENVILKVFEQKYKVIINAPLVQHITLPKFIYVDNIVKPLNLKSIHTIDWMCSFEWFKSKDLKNWTKVGNEFTYKPKYEDLGCFLKLKCLPKNKKTAGPVFEVSCENPIKNMYIPWCPFEERHQETNYQLSGNHFRVVTYNVLSERYTSDGFSYCPPEYLAMEYRRHLLFKEILGYNADIICLQEVDLKILQSFLSRNMIRNGYAGVYHKKGNRIPEGLATFFREDRFSSVESKHYVLSEEIRQNQMFRHLWNAIYKNKEAADKFLKQATSLQITILQEKHSHEIFIVVNTHLYYKWTDNHIRLIQIGMILKYIESVCREWQKRTRGQKTKVALIFCGDFNSKPNSGVYEFITRGFINANHPEWKSENETIKNISLEHKFNFKSAYGTPEFTNYVEDFKGCLDYIFFDASNIALEKISPLPSEDVLSENVALPSIVFPSDHLALVADLKLL